MDAFKTSADYHDALDRREARERAEQEQIEFMKSKQEMLHRIAVARAEQEESEIANSSFSDEELEKCKCDRFLLFYPYVKYSKDCPIHVKHFQLQEAETANNCELCAGTGFRRVSPTMLATCDHSKITDATIYDHPFTQAEVEADYQEYKDLYNMGTGA